MKIAIPLDENKVDVCMVLARAPYFLFIEDGVETVVENVAAQAEGGAGTLVAQFLVDEQVHVLVTPRCGQNAGEVFKVAEILVYKSSHAVAKENVIAYENNELELLTKFHGGYHGIR